MLSSQFSALDNPFSQETVQTPPSIRFVDAPCSAGKTHALIQYLARTLGSARPSPVLSTTDSHLVSFPTLDMTDQFEADLLAAGIPADVIIKITSDTHEGRVVPELLVTLRFLGSQRKIVICCHESLLRLPYVHRTGWRFYADELPALDASNAPLLPRCGWMLSDWLTIQTLPGTDRWARLVPKDVGQLRRHFEEVPDDFELEAKEILRQTVNPFRIAYVDREAWERVIVGGEIDKTNKDRSRVQFFFVLNPAGLDGFTIMGANLRDSALYAWLSIHGARMRPHAELTPCLRFTEHEPRDFEIFYAADRNFNSKHFMKKDFMERFEQAAIEKLGSERYLLHRNSSYRGSLTKQPKCIQPPIKPHGLNRDEYTSCTKLVLAGAFNRNPDHISFMKWLGLTDRAIRQDAYEMAYQFAWRSNLRTQGSKAKVTAIVVDRGTGEFLASKQPGSRVTKLGGFEEFDKKEAMTGAERVRKHREKKKGHNGERVAGGVTKFIDSRKNVTSDQPTTGRHSQSVVTCAQQRRDVPMGSMLGPCRIDHIANVHGADFGDLVVTWPKWIETLSTEAKRVSHEHGPSGLYRPIQAEGREAQDFKAAAGVVLDIDGKDLSPEIIERILWHDAVRKMRFAIYNSFSRSPDKPNKFHVLVPLCIMAITPDEVRAVYDAIVSIIEGHGYKRDSIGLDPQCWSPVQHYHVPCTNAQHTDYAFFRAYGFEPGQEAFSPSPPACLALYPQKETEPASIIRLPVSTEARQRAIDDVRQQCFGMREGRHTKTYWAGMRLAHAGLTDAEIEAELHYNFGDDGNARRHIKGTMLSLRKQL